MATDDHAPPRPVCRPIARATDPREHLKQWIVDEATWWRWMQGRENPGFTPAGLITYRTRCSARIEELIAMWRALVNAGGPLPAIFKSFT